MFKSKALCFSILSLFVMSACSSSGTKVNKASATPAEPDKQFVKILYTKDIGQKEFNQYIQKVGDINSQAKQDQVSSKYDAINTATLNSLKQLKVTDPENKVYLDSLVQLADLSDKVNVAKKAFEKEYQTNKKLSTSSKEQLEGFQSQIQQAYQTAMKNEVSLTEKYASTSSGEIKDFLVTQRILNNELIQVSQLQEKLYQDKTIKTEKQFNQKAKPQLIVITSNVVKSLQSLKSSDVAVNNYIQKLLDYYNAKLAMINKRDQVLAEQTKGQVSTENVNLINRFNQLDTETTDLRLDLLKRFSN